MSCMNLIEHQHQAFIHTHTNTLQSLFDVSIWCDSKRQKKKQRVS